MRDLLVAVALFVVVGLALDLAGSHSVTVRAVFLAAGSSVLGLLAARGRRRSRGGPDGRALR